jgi:hypothetical protein
MPFYSAALLNLRAGTIGGQEAQSLGRDGSVASPRVENRPLEGAAFCLRCNISDCGEAHELER